MSGRERRAMGRDRWGDIYANMPVKKMVALYDYDPQELSPNVDSEVCRLFQSHTCTKLFGVLFCINDVFLKTSTKSITN